MIDIGIIRAAESTNLQRLPLRPYRNRLRDSDSDSGQNVFIDSVSDPDSIQKSKQPTPTGSDFSLDFDSIALGSRLLAIHWINNNETVELMKLTHLH